LLSEFGYVGLLLGIAILFPVFILVFSRLLGSVRIRPKKPIAAKSSTYECGMQTVGDSWVQFNFRYYFFALLFVVFDIVAVFLFPWAINLNHELKLFGLIAMLIFILILTIGFVYAWRKGVLEWK
jgi:NADH-quinone oxidoreductase subunit A